MHGNALILPSLVELTRRLGEPERDLVMLAEGNTSATADEATLFVKASGRSMNGIDKEGFVLVLSQPVLEALDRTLNVEEARAMLNESQTQGAESHMPSTETYVHAYLLSLPEVRFVAHTHPTALLGLLCSDYAQEIARKRLFPDEIVCCGPATCWVEYTAPGLPLARAIRDRVKAFAAEHGDLPKILWLQNHGLIALGRTANEAETATMMAVKAGRIWQSALALQREPTSLTPEQVRQIYTWPDEHFRQKLLWG